MNLLDEIVGYILYVILIPVNFLCAITFTIVVLLTEPFGYKKVGLKNVWSQYRDTLKIKD